MSPAQRVDSWRVGSSSQGSESVIVRKRKRPITPSTGAGRPRKATRMDDDDMVYTPEIAYDNDESEEGTEDEEQEQEQVEEEGDIDEEHEDASDVSDIHLAKPSPPKGYEYEDSDIEVDSTLVVSEEEYHRETSNRRRLRSPPKDEGGVSTEDLRDQGWDDDHIVLVQRIMNRGFEPLMPHHWKFDYRFMPDALFAEDDEAFISSVRNDHYRGLMALEKLLELGGRVRDRILLQKKLNGRVRPEEQTRRMLNEYIKWADQDANLDPQTSIPLLALEMKPANTPAIELQENAKRKLARLAARYREAFRISPSIETTSPHPHNPLLSDNKLLTHPLPTLYALIASHTLIALVAYNPNAAAPGVKSVAFFDMKDRDYDVWNALALACVVCHLRNVRVRIREVTGVGGKGRDEEGKESSDDPDA